MAAIAPARVTLLERPLGPWAGGPYLPPPSKPESSYALPVPRSSEDSSPAPAAAVSPAWVPPPMTVEPPWAKDPRYMKMHASPALGPNPKVDRQQSMRIAKIALGYYNKKNKIKLDLLEVGPVVSVPSTFYPYKHMNFTARSSKEGSREQLFFAELQLCSRKQNPSGFNVICCEPLGSDSTAGRWTGRGMDNPQGTSLERKSVDFTYCFGCGPDIFHPKGMGKRKELSTERVWKGPKRKNMKVAKARAVLKFERSHERFTWKGVLYSDGKRLFKILPPPRHREGIEVDGSCTWFSMASALEAANRACGIEVGQLSWEDLLELVGTQAQFRINSCLRALKYKGIRTRADFLKGNMEAKRYKIAQYTEFCHWELIKGDVISGLDKDNIKAAVDNALSKSAMICYFPISDNYFLDFAEGMNHIYRYDETQKQRMPNGQIATHTAMVTGFGFEEDIPYFFIQDCNGKRFGKNGFCRILPSSIISMFAFDILQD